MTSASTLLLPVPLLAAGLDWLEALLPVIFVIIWIVSQIAAAYKKLAGPKPEARPAAPRPPVKPVGEQPAGGKVGGGLDAELRQQIEAFLGERRPQPITIEQRDPPPLPPAHERRKKRVPQAGSQRPVKRSPPMTLVPAAETSRRAALPSQMAVREMPHLTTTLSDSSIEAATGQPSPTSVAVAGTLAAMLADPASLRQAILLREVLDRPVERWTVGG